MTTSQLSDFDRRNRQFEVPGIYNQDRGLSTSRGIPREHSDYNSNRQHNKRYRDDVDNDEGHDYDRDTERMDRRVFRSGKRFRRETFPSFDDPHVRPNVKPRVSGL